MEFSMGPALARVQTSFSRPTIYFWTKSGYSWPRLRGKVSLEFLSMHDFRESEFGLLE
jgi:hypothetical protein